MLEAAWIVLSQTSLSFGKQVFLILAARDHLTEIVLRLVSSPATGSQTKDFLKVQLGLHKLRFIGLRLGPAHQLILLFPQVFQVLLSARVGRRLGGSHFRLV